MSRKDSVDSLWGSRGLPPGRGPGVSPRSFFWFCLGFCILVSYFLLIGFSIFYYLN